MYAGILRSFLLAQANMLRSCYLQVAPQACILRANAIIR